MVKVKEVVGIVLCMFLVSQCSWAEGKEGFNLLFQIDKKSKNEDIDQKMKEVRKIFEKYAGSKHTAKMGAYNFAKTEVSVNEAELRPFESDDDDPELVASVERKDLRDDNESLRKDIRKIEELLKELYAKNYYRLKVNGKEIKIDLTSKE